jgi:peptidoglycan/LPS O-acetylase OafA/YrhL
MRGVAALMVFARHIWLHSPQFGFLTSCVDLFFVISGFVLANQLTDNSKAGKRRFIMGRVVRIYPMLIPALFVLYLTDSSSGMVGSIATQRPFYLYVLSFLLLQTFWAPIQDILTPLWSLSAEILTNLFNLFVLPKGKALICVAISASFCEMLALWVSPKFGLAWGRGGPVGLFRCLSGFYLGLYLYYLQNEVATKRFAKSWAKLVLSLLVCAGLGFGSTRSAFPMVLLPYAFSILVFQTIQFESPHINPILKHFCKYLGRTSYGIYVWHVVIWRCQIPENLGSKMSWNLNSTLGHLYIGFSTILLVLLATELSIRFIELPVRRWFNSKLNSN